MPEKNNSKWIIAAFVREILSENLFLSRSAVFVFLKKMVILGGVLSTLSACSLDANIASLSQVADIEQTNRKEPDFIHGEVVTTAAGHQMTGVFGEISETKKAFNNSQWEFEGVFYE